MALIGFKPDWPAPSFVHALMTTREGGVSQAPWESLNVGNHVGDMPANVDANRAMVNKAMGATAVYLRQVHGVTGVAIHAQTPSNTEADVAWTTETGVACAMMVADCLPILVCHPRRKWVAAVHAGWRGLAGSQGVGVVETLTSAIQALGMAPQDCLVWLGPCIGPTAFEVGPEVKAAFEGNANHSMPHSHFETSHSGKFLADLAGLARARLNLAGFHRLFGNDSSLPWCTHTQVSKYHSHRRDAVSHGSAGRMAAYVWIRD